MRAIDGTIKNRSILILIFCVSTWEMLFYFYNLSKGIYIFFSLHKMIDCAIIKKRYLKRGWFVLKHYKNLLKK